jgi:chemotaxis protein methyltransferase CheR
MSGGGEQAVLERLRLTVGQLLGFGFQDDQLESLAHAARARQAAVGLPDLAAYVERLRQPETKSEELGQLAELVTVTETFFYRNADQLRAAMDTIVRERQDRGERRLRILSAGCASGEEPYSLAIALCEALPDIEAWDIEILGVDVNRAMLAKARRARYTPWSLRSTPEAIRRRYFSEVSGEIALRGDVTRMVEFRAHNLAEPDPTFYRALACDLIFCRNVIMYFTPEMMRDVVARLTLALRPDGYLFLGHAETLRGVSQRYHLCHTHGTFYYQRREGAAAKSPTFASRLENPELETLPQAVEGADSWFEAIQAASRRVAELTSSTRRASAGATASPAMVRSPCVELGPVLELMQRERFTEARALLDALPKDAHHQPDVLLFSAVLFTNAGRIADAEAVCVRLLENDELNAGAHYLKALCREHAGDRPGAAEHDRIASHLDPAFAMPHLHAGLLAKRAGDALVARRELGQARLLLEREDTSRVVLFGGGFSREALTALCRAELAKLGGPA